MKLLINKKLVAVKGEVSEFDRRGLTKKGTLFMSFFVASLRGRNEFMIYAAGLQHHTGKGRELPLALVVIPMMGRFKRETGIIHHLQAVVNEKASKLKVRLWLESLNN